MKDSGTHSGHTERRKWARYTIDIPVKVKVGGAGGIATYCYGRGTDVGEGGMSIYVAHELTVGKSMDLTLTLPYSERAISCRVVVRNRESFKYGVAFRDMSEGDRDLLLETCRKLGVLQSI